MTPIQVISIGTQGPAGPPSLDVGAIVVGTEGQVVTVVGGAPVFADPSGTPLSADQVSYGDPSDTTVAIPAPFFDVISRGADNTGVANSRDAFMSAIAAAEAAGAGTIRPPRGTYRIEITATGADQHCLVVDGDNITIDLSDGAVLICHPYGGDADTHWQNVSGDVWRGAGIFVTAGADYANRRRGFRLLGGEIDGTFTYTGDHTFPANVSTGDGWDVTHKGVWFENDLYHDDHTVEGCHIHNFSGEVVYAGGFDAGGDEPGLGTFRVINNRIHDTNGSAISITGKRVIIQRNEVWATAGNGIENAYEDGEHVIQNNTIRDVLLDGISLSGINEGIGSARVENNDITRCTNYGIGVMSGWNARVAQNRVTDCVAGGIRTEVIAGAGGDNNTTVQDLDIFDNLVQADHASVSLGIAVSLSAGQAKRVRVMRNTINRTVYAAANGFIVIEPIAAYSDIDQPEISLADNTYYGTHGDFTAARVVNTLLTSTGNQYPLQFKSSLECLALVQVSIRVITGATTVAIKIHDGTGYVATVQSSTSLAVGSYSYPGYLVQVAKRANMSVEVNTGTANQVYVSGIIREA